MDIFGFGLKWALFRLSVSSQIEIMSIVWEKGETTVNAVLQSVNQNRKKKLKRTTIQVQMNRLEEKGWLAHKLIGRTFHYRALRIRDEARADIAVDFTERVFNGSCAELVKCLFEGKKVSDEEIRRLKKFLDLAKGG